MLTATARSLLSLAGSILPHCLVSHGRSPVHTKPVTPAPSKANACRFAACFAVHLITGSAGPYVCAVVSGKCDMAQSAINAVESVRQYYSVPYSNIEITPMIGGNDVIDETFTIANAQTVAAYARSKGVGGVHFWSLDRDRDCAPGYASSTCNTYGQAGTLGFTNTFLSALA